MGALRAAAAITLFLLGSTIGLSAQGNLTWTPCVIPGLEGEVRCTKIPVPEVRGVDGGRRIEIHVAVARARNESGRRTDPLWMIAGGPGQAASGMGPFATTAFGRVREHRDIVLVDVRGTDRSAPLQCALYRTPAALLGETYPKAAVEFCRDSLAAHAVLTAYTTEQIVQDLEEVRRRLGGEKINLYGTSYGTRVALVYMRRFPGSIRAAILKSAAPAAMRAPTFYAPDGQVAMEKLFSDCRAEGACAAAFSDLPVQLNRLLDRAERGELRVGLDVLGGAPGDSVALTRDLIAPILLGALQSVHDAATLPALIAMAAGGQLRPLTGLIAQYRRGLNTMIATGMHLSVMCAEDTKLIDAAEAAREARGTFLGNARVRAQLGACASWPAAPLPADYASTVRSTVPTLFVSGDLDPNTPARWADSARAGFTRSWHVVLPGVAHSFSSAGTCGAEWMAAFLERATGQGLDLSCVAGIRRPPFSPPPGN
ncbi:MAG: alpha/beta fold hydrolase [Gemmatimonadales bacterium]|nr:alpha/beta fold hydrolase [Gemmatimonadales bacterium]